jgi:hypothetical protein
MGGAAGVLAIVVVAALLVWKPWKSEPPRLNDEPYKIAKFAISPEFKKLEFERQFTYMELLDDKEDAVAQAYKDHLLNDDEYARTLQVAYLGKHMKRARNFAEKTTPRAREAYLDKLIEKKEKNDAAEKAAAKANKTKALTAEEIKRDDTGEEETINAWPADAVATWTTYRTALKARKDQLKDQEERERSTTQGSPSPATPTAKK